MMPGMLPEDTFDLVGAMRDYLGDLDPSTKLFEAARAAVRACRTTPGMRGYAYVISTFLDYAKTVPLEPWAFTVDDLEDWRDSMTLYKPSTREQRLNVIRTFYREALRVGYVTENPAETLEEGDWEDDGAPVALTLEQVRLLIGNIRAEFNDPRRFLVARRDLCIVLFGVVDGLRASAMRRYQFGDMDFSSPGKPTFLTFGKRRSTRRLKLQPVVSDAVLDFRAELERVGVRVYDYDPVLISLGVEGIPHALRRRTKDPLPVLSEPNLYEAVKHRLAAIGVTGVGVGPHRLRKTCGTIIWQSTHDIVLAQKQLGHASPHTTIKHYIEPADALEESGSDYIDI